MVQDNSTISKSRLTNGKARGKMTMLFNFTPTGLASHGYTGTIKTPFLDTIISE